MPTTTEINATTNVETWETTTHSQVAVNRYDRKGGEKATVVGGEPGKRVQVTTAEREELNEERSANEKLDPFKNGFLRPIRSVPDEVKQRFETETKPNGGQSTEELMELLGKTGNAFKVAVERLNEPTLRRLQVLAPEADAKASQIEAIETAMEKYKVTLRETDAEKQLRAGPNTPGNV